MKRSARLRRLHFLNALFAPLTGHDLYLAGQFDAAIRAGLAENAAASDTTQADDTTLEPEDPSFVQAAAQLFAKLCEERSAHGFFHWDATQADTSGSPLFARAGLMQGLKGLAACQEATVLVTNLRAAHCSGSGRWSPKRQREYHETLSLLRDLTAARTRRGANVNLLFL
jgi:hypothetical protein